MPFELIWSDKSKKDLRLIDRAIAARIVEKMEEAAGQDTIFLEKVKGTDYFKYRVGKYRVIIEKFPATKKLFVVKVGHRKNIYKKI